MTSPSPTAAAKALAEQAATAWERLDAGCAGLLANQCKRHPPYMGCAMDCTDMANALDPEHAEARTAIPPALALLAQLCDQLDAAREECERLRESHARIHSALIAWRTWSDGVMPPWGRTTDRGDAAQRDLIDERIATLTRERDAFSTDMLARERDTALAEAARLREALEEARAASGITAWASDVRLAANIARDRDEWRTQHDNALASWDADRRNLGGALVAARAERDKLRALLDEAIGLAISFEVNGAQPGERDRLATIRTEALK